MSATEPTGTVGESPTETIVPEQRDPVAEERRTEPVVDHVHTHARTCYWDHLACRWQCAGR
jgi:hypothetical protein